MSSSIVRLYNKRKPSKKQVERAGFVREFTKKNSRPPTLKEIAIKYKISITTAWETMERINKNDGTCRACGKSFL